MDFIKKIFSKSSEIKIPKWFFVTGLILVCIGLINAAYLTYSHYQISYDSFCPVTAEGYGDCHDVTNSEYSVILGVPLAVLGVLYYISVLFVLIILWKKKKECLLWLLSVVTSLGLLFSIWLVYLQLWVLQAICPYCMLSALVSVLLFVLDVVFIFQSKKIKSNLYEYKKA
jgi:uncharacterized membrane protein